MTDEQNNTATEDAGTSANVASTEQNQSSEQVSNTAADPNTQGEEKASVDSPSVLGTDGASTEPKEETENQLTGSGSVTTDVASTNERLEKLEQSQQKTADLLEKHGIREAE